MTTDLPPVPPAVIKFAEQKGYKRIEVNKFWDASTPQTQYNGFKVFNVVDNDVYFRFILVNNKEIRMATDKESIEIADIYF